MKPLIEITLPGVPQGKGRPRMTRTGKPYTPAKTRAYEAALKLAGRQAMAGRAPLEGPLQVQVVALFPVPPSWTKRKQEEARRGAIRPTVTPDADNLGKAACDALNKVVWVDDAQVVDLHVVKHYGVTLGTSEAVGMAIRVWRWPAQEPEGLEEERAGMLGAAVGGAL